MSVKWIKITTDIFDDEKIKIIDTMPARDEIIVIWFKLLTLSGKVNENGMLFMNSKIAYTPEMLAAIFNRELNTVKLALSTFEMYGMIEVEENQLISISNWEKHQNIDGLDKIREQNRIRQQKHREKKQLLIESNVTDNVTITNGNAPEEEEELELEKEKEIKHIHVFDKWNELASHKHKTVTKNILEQLNKLTTAKAEEVLIAIDRYVKANNDPDYFYNNSWTLDKFIKQGNGYTSWLDDGSNWVMYIDRKPKQQINTPTKKPKFIDLSKVEVY